MKKMLLAVIFAASIFSGTAGTTQAEEKLDLANIVYPANVEGTEYYSLDLLTYASNYKKFAKGSNNFDHVTLTNNQTYTLIDYASTYVAATKEGSTQVLGRALNKLTTTKKSQNLAIVPGKFSSGKVIANAEAAPTVFEVVDIK